MLYATHLSNTTSYSYIKINLSAIKHFNILTGQVLPSLPRLYLLLRGIKRMQGNAHARPKRQPITPLILLQLHQFLQRAHITEANKRMLWAAFTTAFFGFLRASEFVAPTTKTFSHSQTLMYEDVTMAATCALIKIKCSKTDPFSQGCIIRLPPTKSTLCPMSALYHHLATHPNKRGPLFTYSNGTFLTRRRLNSLLKTALTPSNNKPVSSHSFRIGAATTAAAAGYPRWLIQHLGRWTSDCFRTYTRLSDETITNVSCNLAKNTQNITISTWNPDL